MDWIHILIHQNALCDLGWLWAIPWAHSGPGSPVERKWPEVDGHSTFSIHMSPIIEISGSRRSRPGKELESAGGFEACGAGCGHCL